MARAFLLVLDSLGIGGAPDAARFGDEGADTLGHIHDQCAAGNADRPGLRTGALDLPNMGALGLYRAAALATGKSRGNGGRPLGFHGAANEISSGKDTPSGHWEIAGVPVLFDWGYFPEREPALPTEFTAAILAESGLGGFLGGVHASGTQIIARHGEEHMRTGWPIFYTSADSVLQIAAHEESFGLERLYHLCGIARRHADSLNIGRVIARPFLGNPAQGFVRTANRRDYAVPPPEPTLLDRIHDRGSRVFAIGKIADIFTRRGVTDIRKGIGNMGVFDAVLTAMDEAADGDLVFANFVDFDSEHGHRRDVPGYAAALEAFDRRLPEILARLVAGDLLILTADHGCDPTWHGTDHTRERVPIIGTGPGMRPVPLGIRDSLSDIGATIGEHLGVTPGAHGVSFYGKIAENA